MKTFPTVHRLFENVDFFLAVDFHAFERQEQELDYRDEQKYCENGG
jgi:hypothetical protein